MVLDMVLEAVEVLVTLAAASNRALIWLETRPFAVLGGQGVAMAVLVVVF